MARLTQWKRLFPGVKWLPRLSKPKSFPGSKSYWESRYRKGGSSGGGSYGKRARFKADVVNAIVRENGVSSVIEFGCGDGAQLSLAQYPSYVGLDVSPTALRVCEERFQNDPTKTFSLYNPESFRDADDVIVADVALSLDVIYHLIEDRVFELYMAHLFAAARRFVVIYSSNRDEGATAAHVRHRQFTQWVAEKADGWKLKTKINNDYPFDSDRNGETSFADFYVFEKAAA